MPPNKRPRPKTSRAASKVLRRKKSGAAAKTAAGYTLSDSPGKGGRKKDGKGAGRKGARGGKKKGS
jgi:hypothetical protein